ncbi:unnamed protein product [Brassicogethes aeneus]|uniref:ATR-interacting protein n=1 Tax=Brassicogethes aeneus TaxID=1431903 RepID=A0A9P0BDM5_BRAAE|nr:unnamed protein product [Brassicogethes aeneus]
MPCFCAKMTKRYGQFEETNSKKSKLEDNLDDLWGDDDDFDDCVRIATQVEEKIVATQHNTSIVQNYTLFKDPNVIFSSTQLNTSFQTPSTSNNVEKSEIIKLKTQYDEKVGEVSILRNQLQETKQKLLLEQQKKQDEWKEKFNFTQKEIRSLQSELEFKNLEISNLKQKVLDVSKHNFEASNSLNVSKIVQENRKLKQVSSDNEVNLHKIQALVSSVYPLSQLSGSSIFNTNLYESYCTKSNINNQCRNTIPYLQNQDFHLSENLSKIKNKPKPFILNEKELTLEYLYPEISYLICCTQEELNLDKNIEKINKILITSIQFLMDLKEYLDYIKDNMRIEDLQQADSNYLNKIIVDSTDFTCDKIFERDKIGIKAGHTILILSQLIPHCVYLSNYLIHSKKLIFKEGENYSMFPFVKNNKFEEDFFYLNLILSVTEIVGQIRKSCDVTGFLYSVIDLLTNICKSNNFDFVWYNVCAITKEVLFSKPLFIIVYKCSYLFKHASLFPNFIEFMFKKMNNSIKISSKKGVLYYNPESCCFYVFAMLFVNSVFTENQINFPVKICINLLTFIYNTFKYSLSLHHKNVKQCECLAQLYKIEIDIVFKALNIYNNNVKNKKIITDEWNDFFKHEITIKVLNLMTFHSYELTEKYVIVYSQFKEIQRCMMSKISQDIEQLNISEEIPNIPNNHSAFCHL